MRDAESGRRCLSGQLHEAIDIKEKVPGPRLSETGYLRPPTLPQGHWQSKNQQAMRSQHGACGLKRDTKQESSEACVLQECRHDGQPELQPDADGLDAMREASHG